MAGYHLFSTGEVLTAANVNDYVMKQTVMVFASAAARTTALSGVLREGMVSYRTDSHITEYYNGSAWATLGSVLTTKGDLATFDTASQRLAVGADGTTLVANSSAATGLSYQPLNSAGKNAIINGGFDIWARGTSGTANSSSSGAGYNADRWQNFASGTAITVARQVTSDTTNLPSIQYCSRVQRNSGQTSTGVIYNVQTAETLNSIPLVGKQVTLSFYARAGANFSATSNTLSFQVVYGTGTDQNLFSFTGSTAAFSSSGTLTTTWQRFQATGTISTTATELGVNIFYTPTGTAGANDYYEVTGIQLELGSVATNFSRAGGSIGGELALCQRYYWRQTAGTTGYGIYGWGTCANSTTFQPVMKFPVTMRTVPTALDYTSLATGDGVTITATSTAALLTNSTPEMAYLNITVTGLTQFKFYYLQANNTTSSYIAVNAEL